MMTESCRAWLWGVDTLRSSEIVNLNMSMKGKLDILFMCLQSLKRKCNCHVGSDLAVLVAPLRHAVSVLAN